MVDVVGYRRETPGTHPPHLFPGYASTQKRAPVKPFLKIPHTLSEVTGPMFGHDRIGPTDTDLTKQVPGGEPIGERMILSGRVLDEDGKPIPHTLVELWQCNSAGRYHHPVDQHNAPLDPFFIGAGRMVTNDKGEYRFTTIRPGEYPWRNHYNAWRPAHIHLSLFGPSFLTRMVTQMYFPGDPLLPLDPIFNSISDEKARNRLISSFDLETTIPEEALGYKFDIVLRGRDATPMEND